MISDFALSDPRVHDPPSMAWLPLFPGISHLGGIKTKSMSHRLQVFVTVAVCESGMLRKGEGLASRHLTSASSAIKEPRVRGGGPPEFAGEAWLLGTCYFLFIYLIG